MGRLPLKYPYLGYGISISPLVFIDWVASSMDLFPSIPSIVCFVICNVAYGPVFPGDPILSFSLGCGCAWPTSIMISKIPYGLTRTCFGVPSPMLSHRVLTAMDSKSAPSLSLGCFAIPHRPLPTVDIAAIGAIPILSRDRQIY